MYQGLCLGMSILTLFDFFAYAVNNMKKKGPKKGEARRIRKGSK